MSADLTAHPESGQCWVCYRPDSVPPDKRDRIPELCSDECRAGWVELYRVPDLATHVVVDDQWVPAPAPPVLAPVVEDHDTTLVGLAVGYLRGQPGGVVGVRPVPKPGEWWASVRARWAK